MTWPGGKDGSGVAQRLINEIPPHRVFVSAFLGDCAILRRKRPAAVNVGIDLDAQNVERWDDWLQSTPPPFPAPLELYCCDAIEWLRHRFGWYRVAGNGAVSWPYSSPHAPRGSRSGGTHRTATLYRATVAAVAANGDQAGRVAAAGGEGSRDAETFVYADPPYLMQSRRSTKRLYAHEMTDEQHGHLVGTLKSLPCLVMVSHYPCRLYDEAFADWRSFTFQTTTRGGKPATEKVWCNYPPPIELHDSRYLGRNKRQREKIRRRVRNWSQGLARMPALERQAILDAITGRGM